MLKIIRRIGLETFVLALAIIFVLFYINKSVKEHRLLEEIIKRLSAESRVAEAVVVDVKQGAVKNKYNTTIKFIEYSSDNHPLPPLYFTFSGNLIQFQALVIRFDDFLVKSGNPLKGKSAYIFMKAFMLTDQGAEVFPINKKFEIPSGYEVEGVKNPFERKLWRRFWEYALNPAFAQRTGIKNAQIEAPGTKFIPGMLYTIKIEHDGGLRIDASKIPEILKKK